jgi:dTDP-4-dehydrorhamnose reductase
MDMLSKRCRPELWGGIECTINRIGNRFRDQLIYAGHYDRPDDIDLLAKLGITHLRYPLLWERHEPSQGTVIDWRWIEGQLDRMKKNDIVPVVGLLHHGSGPAFTDLLDTSFPEKFARYVEAVATKFPWLTHYVPVNEPLTTARFSTLYGHWYPHRRDDRAFVRALVNQIMATCFAVRIIKKINPASVFIQTEDLAKVHSTEVLKYQADFENERRWLSFDLLCGRVTPVHPMWNYLRSNGASDASLNFFIDNPCPPDVLGHNYYVTSERYLDDNIDSYPGVPIGGNVKHNYVDVEAQRVGVAAGLKELLLESRRRYRLPIVLTEVHLGCTCDEQIRWFVEAWNTVCELYKTGDVRAITAWSLMGAFDWDSLLTRNQLSYECGAYDLRSGRPMLTELGEAIATIGTTGKYVGPYVDSPGWWHQARIRESIAV